MSKKLNNPELRVGAQRLHLNPKQILARMLFAKNNTCIFGRGAGKTHGLIAPYLVKNAFSMPRSTGSIGQATFKGLLMNTVPQVIKGIEAHGYIEDKHFWVGKKPNIKGLATPYLKPKDHKYSWYWFNGSCNLLQSQDENATQANGQSVDYGVFDEAKKANKQKLDETMSLILRGNTDKFGHLHNHLSMLYVTDMPETTDGDWLLDMEQFMNKELFKGILEIELKIAELYNSYFSSVSPASKKMIWRKIQRYEEISNGLKMGETFYLEATTLDNIHVLGIPVIEGFKRALDDDKFDMSVLNQRRIEIENCFYPHLSEQKQGYTATNVGEYEKIEFFNYREPTEHLSSRWDGDLVADAPLLIAPDAGAHFNCAVIGQRNRAEFRFVNCFWVKGKGRIKELVKNITQYYRPHRKQLAQLVFDQTLIGENAMDDNTPIKEWAKRLRDAGWHVQFCYVGASPAHRYRLDLWDKACHSSEYGQLKFSFNIDNCSQWFKSCKNAPTKVVNGKVKKDKSSEKPGSVTPPEMSTHLSEAGDILLYYGFGIDFEPRPYLGDSGVFAAGF